jgi:hypothetical protein
MENLTDISIQLSEALLKHGREAARKKGFGSLEEFLVFLLKKELRMEEEETISEEEKEKIKERLRKLGYLE